MAYTNPKMSSLFRSEACASQVPSAAEGWADALNNPAYVRNFDVAKELAKRGEIDDNTLTEAMAAAQISNTAPATSTTTSEPVRPLLSRPQPPRLVLFQRGGPQALAMYQGPPPTPAWNANELAEHFVYEGEARAASAPPETMAGEEEEEEEEENLVQVDAVAEDEEEEMTEARSMPGWQNPRTKRRARQVLDLLDQEVLDAMSTDNLIWIMQAGFQSLVARRVRH